MTPAAQTPAPRATFARPARPVYRVTARRVLRSEWAKLWSLRSTWITLGLAALFVVAFGLIASFRYKTMIDSGRGVDLEFADATAVSLSAFGTAPGLLAVGVLGVLVTGGEYSTGMIRSTLTAVPRRLPVLWSKVAVYGLVAFTVGTGAVFITFVFASAIVSSTPAALSLSSAGVVRSLLGAGLYLALVGVIGTALGALLRSIAGGIAMLVGVMMLVPGLALLLPTSWHNDIGPFLPSNAGASMFAVDRQPHTLSPGIGLAVIVGWTALVLAAAAYRLVRSDA
ncbi:ABC transporter permease [Kitasatospora sp. GAS204B]|uniref:ABC transporter permease n=1 Tax=unclassified Kitasatospora TaxID=2633591 RepID=UPI002473A445|nr:ABC transporter permease [Kitasatospora sp. GAS204B]MDH6119770.1 ABC-2 type transport system permease protein [Kitasatospora sp. GAS204B]